MDYRSLPAVNAILNSLSAICLLAGYWMIRKGRREDHRRFMLGAVGFSILFLASYLTYHFQVGSVKFTEQGLPRVIYFSILITHTILAMAIVPMVLITLVRALKGRFEHHKRIARWTLPVWLYVSVTGVLIYLMLYQIWVP